MCKDFNGIISCRNGLTQMFRFCLIRPIFCIIFFRLICFKFNQFAVDCININPRVIKHGTGPLSPLVSFVHWNPSLLNSISHSELNRITPYHSAKGIATSRVNIGIKCCKNPSFALGLFGSLGSWFSNTFKGKWFVPPMPTGNFASAILRKKGRLQTDAETQKFFETIGVTKDASLPHIVNSYHNAIQTMSTERQKQLQETFEEFLRKDFVEAFEHMESYMQHGPAAWEEYWNPYKDEFGNPIEHSEERAMLKEHLIDEFTPPGINISEFREYWKANNTRFSAMMRNVDISARLRLTSNFFGRLPRACIFMLPVMGLGLFPQYSSLSLGIQGLLASGFIFKGDRESILAKEKTTETFLPLAEPVAKSKSSRTLVTSAVLTVHSLLGIGISKLLNAYTTLSEYLPYEMLRVACINIQFFIAALLWDTSDMTRTAFVEREKKRMSKLSKYLTKLESDEDE